MSANQAALDAVLRLLPDGDSTVNVFQQAFNGRRYRIEPRGAAFAAIAEPPLPNGVKEAERPSYELAAAVARLWRLEHGGKLAVDVDIKPRRRGKCEVDHKKGGRK